MIIYQYLHKLQIIILKTKSINALTINMIKKIIEADKRDIDEDKIKFPIFWLHKKVKAYSNMLDQCPSLSISRSRDICHGLNLV